MCAKFIPFFLQIRIYNWESNLYRIVSSIFEGELDHKKQNFFIFILWKTTWFTRPEFLSQLRLNLYCIFLTWHFEMTDSQVVFDMSGDTQPRLISCPNALLFQNRWSKLIWSLFEKSPKPRTIASALFFKCTAILFS